MTGHLYVIYGWKMHLEDALGCIFSDVPGVIRGFGFFNIRPLHPGDPSGVDQVPDCIPAALIHGFALFIQSHLVAFCATSVMVHMGLLFAAPVTPSLVRAVQIERPANPRQPTSTGSQRAAPNFSCFPRSTLCYQSWAVESGLMYIVFCAHWRVVTVFSHGPLAVCSVCVLKKCACSGRATQQCECSL